MKKILYALVLICAAAGCRKKDDKEAFVIKAINESALEQTVYADDTLCQSLTFVTTEGWYSMFTQGMFFGDGWISVTPSRNDTAGEYTINIKLEPNYTGGDRTGYIGITTNESEESLLITIKQKGTRRDGIIQGKVTGVTLNTNTAKIVLGESPTLALTATVTTDPKYATNKNVIWTSSAPGVATVDDGVVTPISGGTAVITATTAEGGKTAQCTVTVVPPASGAQMFITHFHDLSHTTVAMAGSGSASIDWGDGSAKETYTILPSYNSPDNLGSFSHSYTSTSVSTITVTGENITGLRCPEYGTTDVDVSKNTALYELRIQTNQFSVAGLNALFDTLHGNVSNESHKNILIGGNPGATTALP